MNKYCSKCKLLKNESDFYFRSDKPHLLQSHCKACIQKSRKEYRLQNIEKFKLRDKIYQLNNKKKKSVYLKKWQKEHKEERLVKDKIRRKIDIRFVLRSRIHNRIRQALKRNSKHSTSSELLGCDILYFRIYFESKFTNNMDWENFLNGNIHIDHKIPCAKFDLSKEEDQKKCFHYTNLQPLWAKDNLLKRDKEVCYR